MNGPVIGLIGAGRAGSPAVERLLDVGREVHLYARRADVKARLAARGAHVCDSPRDVVRAADILILFVFSGAQVLELLVTDDAVLSAMRPGGIVLVHTTTSIGELDELAAAAAAAGLEVVDAPVSGTAADVEVGALTVLLGGSDAAVESCRAVVGAYASTVVRVGPIGSAMRIKLLNNIIFAAHLQIAAATIGVAAEVGIESQRCMDALLHCSGASSAMEIVARSGGDVTEFGHRAGPYMRKDVAACIRMAADLGLDLGILPGIVRGGPLPLAPA